MSLAQRFAEVARGLADRGPKVVVAVSGGPDSVALLDLLVKSRDLHRLELVVAHLDHGIHLQSSRVAEQVRMLAEGYGLQCEVGRLALGATAGETEARARRYAWLEAVRLQTGAESILTAHHGDDQAETVLMRVLAGSGPAGLAAMSRESGRIVRPLLGFRRSELAEYVGERGLPAWTDPANTDVRHLRSWLRSDILPQLRSHVPEVDRNLLRLATQAAQNRDAWEAVLEVLPGLDVQHEVGEISVAASTFAGYDSSLAQAILFVLARRIGCRLGPARVGRVLQLVASGSSGSQVPLGSFFFAELSFGRLRLVAAPRPAAEQPWILAGERGKGTWGRWHFHWESAVAPGDQDRSGLRAWFTREPLSVRSWLPGERLRPLGGTGRRLLVRCFQEGQVPRSRRGSWPVLSQSDDIVWIPGVCRSDARVPAAGTEAVRVDAEYT
jgi:tRNA(Ile)-lysidine synthase